VSEDNCRFAVQRVQRNQLSDDAEQDKYRKAGIAEVL